MASEVVQNNENTPVRSRVSWGAILAGAMVALALYFLLTLLGVALGLSVSDSVRPGNLGTAAAVWAIAATVLSLFVGGYVTSLFTVGENRLESVIGGVVLWSVLFGMLLLLMASGVRSGFGAMVGMAQGGHAAAGSASSRDWEAVNPAPPASTTRKGDDPQARQEVADTATKAAWWAVLGTLGSMLASVAGACVGARPTFRHFALPPRRPMLPDRQPVGSH